MNEDANNNIDGANPIININNNISYSNILNIGNFRISDMNSNNRF
jgi:hypothetical protein